MAGNSGNSLLRLCYNGNGFSLTLTHGFSQMLTARVTGPSITTTRCGVTTGRVSGMRVVHVTTRRFARTVGNIHRFGHLRKVSLGDCRYRAVFISPPHDNLSDRARGVIRTCPHVLCVSYGPRALYGGLRALDRARGIRHLTLFSRFPCARRVRYNMLLATGWGPYQVHRRPTWCQLLDGFLLAIARLHTGPRRRGSKRCYQRRIETSVQVFHAGCHTMRRCTRGGANDYRAQRTCQRDTVGVALVRTMGHRRRKGGQRCEG